MALGVETSSSPGIERLVGGVEVWMAKTDPGSDPDLLGRCRDLLTEEERAAASAFHHESDRRRAVVSRALLRTTLSRYARVAPAAWRFERGAHGRPQIVGPGAPRLRFSVSHTRELAVCAVTLDVPIGVDLEPIGRDVHDLVASETILSRAEIDALRALDPREREQRFLEIWTLKEAYLKALGTGLARCPSELEFDLGDPGTIVGRLGSEAEERGPEWWFAILRVEAHQDLVLALSRRGRPAHVASFLATPPEDGFALGSTTLRASSPSRSRA